MLGIEPKDLAPIVISLVALLVSLGTFVYERYQNHKQQKVEKSRLVYIAYKLGSDLMYAWMPQILVGQGDKNEIERIKSEALSLIQLSQGLADQLDLRVNLVTLIQSFNLSEQDTLLDESPFERVRLRIQTVHNKTIAAAFDLGQWLMFLHFMAGTTILNNNEDLDDTLDRYRQLKDFITEDFSELEIKETIQNGLETAESIVDESKRLRERMDSILSY